MSSLCDVVRSAFIPYIPCAVSWGFAMSNLQQPYTARHVPKEGGHEGHGVQADDAMEVEGDGDDDDDDDHDDGSGSDSNNTHGTKRSRDNNSLSISPRRRFQRAARRFGEYIGIS